MRRKQRLLLATTALLAAILFLFAFSGCETPTTPTGCDSTPNDPGQNEDPGTVPGTIDGNGYHEQRMQFVNISDGSYLTAETSSLEASVSADSNSSTSNQWVLQKSGSDSYQIKNVASGAVLAPNGNTAESGASVVVTGSPNGSSQYWKLVPVQTDANSNALSYKLVNAANTRLALTLSNGACSLSSDSGAATQRFLFNAYGAQGFAGYCKNMNNRDVASITGGVLGSVVTVSSLSELQRYASGATPYTIVIGRDISASFLTKVNVGKNKTFIGSYGSNTLNNIHFRCISDSGNIIFKNITFSHNSNINANDDIQVYISSGNKFWLDHCTFTGHSRTTSSDVDKFIYVGLYADYVSVTECDFGIHKYGLILGYYNDNDNRYNGYPRMTIANNYFHGTVTRAPGLMRYGYYHSYNNYVTDFHLGYTVYTNANVYSENNYFQGGAVVDNNTSRGAFTDKGSVLSSSVSILGLRQTSWRPSGNYSYSAKPASQVPAWCKSYTGSQSSTLVYAID